MRVIILMLLLVTVNIVTAQDKYPAGVANTYTLSEKDGYDGSNYILVKTDSIGNTYTAQYNNTFTISGNNFSISFDTLKKIASSIIGIKIITNSEAWAIGNNYIASFKDKRLTKLIKTPEKVFHYLNGTGNKSCILFTYEHNYLTVYLFDGEGFKKLSVTNQIINLFTSIRENADGNIWLSQKKDYGIDLFKLNHNTYLFDIVKKIVHPKFELLYYIEDENNFIAYTYTNNRFEGYNYINGNITKTPYSFNNGNENVVRLNISQPDLTVLYKIKDEQHFICHYDSGILKKDVPFYRNDYVNAIWKVAGGSYISHSANKPFRIFPYIKKYPRIYNNNNSNNIFTVKQDDIGRIWAGSYQSKLSIIDNNVVTQLPEKRFSYMNGGSFYNDHMYLIGEGAGGIVQFDKRGNGKQFNPPTYTGYYTYVSKNKKYFYFGTPNNFGLWQTSTSKLESLQPKWNKIDTNKGSNIDNILSITEDTLGRIWYGHPRIGIALYNPATNKATTWLTEKKESNFGIYSSLTDKHGTIWIGSGNKGLWYYTDYTKPAKPGSFIKVNHPFLINSNPITALTICKDWLIIAATDKVLLLNIDSLYNHKKTVVRYLNPQEASFTSTTEQNTLITSHTDSSVWFSTSDMLYQWDVKKWLSLPTYKVGTEVLLLSKDSQFVLHDNAILKFPSGFNAFEIQCRYVSPDNLPRYISAVLVKDGDSLLMPLPTLQSNFSFKNLESGNYTFYVDVFESDGSITHYLYPIVLKKYLWQQWWFWLLLSLAAISIIFYLYNLKRKKQLAEEKAKTKEAELSALKSEQEKKIATLQLTTLSNQFRPHFILNALNTIGAQMDDKPQTETVLSSLGESVMLIFNHAKQQKTLHTFENEWTLVKNAIQIHTLMYLKDLEVNLPDAAALENAKNIEMPLGILQIPIENALLHGLSNKEYGPWHLSITVFQDDRHLVIKITDNGVGRKRSATLSNFTKHGTGTKNINEIIDIINNSNTEKISIVYGDEIFKDNENKYGTCVTIEIPIYLNYASS